MSTELSGNTDQAPAAADLLAAERRGTAAAHQSHALGGRVEAAIQHANPKAASVLVHREPDPADVVTTARIARSARA